VLVQLTIQPTPHYSYQRLDSFNLVLSSTTPGFRPIQATVNTSDRRHGTTLGGEPSTSASHRASDRVPSKSPEDQRLAALRSPELNTLSNEPDAAAQMSMGCVCVCEGGGGSRVSKSGDRNDEDRSGDPGYVTPLLHLKLR
jgi:hypothetical protein